jgi:hypothetical protein
MRSVKPARAVVMRVFIRTTGFYYTTAAAILLATILPASARAAVIYDWSADCETGCTGTASGVLTLIDTYTPGDPFTSSEFIS